MADEPSLMNAPPTPAEVSTFIENGKFVFKTDDTVPIYFSDKDGKDKSNCVAACAMTWKPVAAPPDATKVGDWTAITRTDKTKQWAYKGKPVYTYAHDGPGQMTGDGAEGGQWHNVKP